MKRSTCLLLLGAAVAVPAALGGCQHAHRPCVSCCGSPLAAVPVMTSPYAAVHVARPPATLTVSTTPSAVETAELTPVPPAITVQPVAVREPAVPMRLQGYGLQPRDLAG